MPSFCLSPFCSNSESPWSQICCSWRLFSALCTSYLRLYYFGGIGIRILTESMYFSQIQSYIYTANRSSSRNNFYLFFLNVLFIMANSELKILWKEASNTAVVSTSQWTSNDRSEQAYAYLHIPKFQSNVCSQSLAPLSESW